jgi:hypothetical protein
MADVTIQATKTAGVRSPGRAPIAARTLRTDRWWAYPLTTFGVLLAFVAYAAYIAIANRDYYAAPYPSPFYSPCLSLHCACRHAVGGRINHFSRHPIRYRAWTFVSRLNPYHGNFAWASLAWVALTDLYVRLVAGGAITDPRVF